MFRIAVDCCNSVLNFLCSCPAQTAYRYCLQLQRTLQHVNTSVHAIVTGVLRYLRQDSKSIAKEFESDLKGRGTYMYPFKVEAENYILISGPFPSDATALGKCAIQFANKLIEDHSEADKPMVLFFCSLEEQFAATVVALTEECVRLCLEKNISVYKTTSLMESNVMAKTIVHADSALVEKRLQLRTDKEVYTPTGLGVYLCRANGISENKFKIFLPSDVESPSRGFSLKGNTVLHAIPDRGEKTFGDTVSLRKKIMVDAVQTNVTKVYVDSRPPSPDIKSAAHKLSVGVAKKIYQQTTKVAVGNREYGLLDNHFIAAHLTDAINRDGNLRKKSQSGNKIFDCFGEMIIEKMLGRTDPKYVSRDGCLPEKVYYFENVLLGKLLSPEDELISTIRDPGQVLLSKMLQIVRFFIDYVDVYGRVSKVGLLVDPMQRLALNLRRQHINEVLRDTYMFAFVVKKHAPQYSLSLQSGKILPILSETNLIRETLVPCKIAPCAATCRPCQQGSFPHSLKIKSRCIPISFVPTELLSGRCAVAFLLPTELGLPVVKEWTTSRRKLCCHQTHNCRSNHTVTKRSSLVPRRVWQAYLEDKGVLLDPKSCFVAGSLCLLCGKENKSASNLTDGVHYLRCTVYQDIRRIFKVGRKESLGFMIYHEIAEIIEVESCQPASDLVESWGKYPVESSIVQSNSKFQFFCDFLTSFFPLTLLFSKK